MRKIHLLIFILFCLFIFEYKVNALNNGVYVIRSSVNNNMVLDVTGGSTSNGTNIQLFQYNGTKAQQWDITYLNNGYYKISSFLNLGKVLDVAGASKLNGTNLQLHESNSTNAQEWIIKETGNGYYYIISKCNGLYLDVDSSKMVNGTNIQLWQGYQNPAQTFKLDRVYDSEKTIKNGSYIIRSSINNNMVLDVTGGVTSNGTNIQLHQENGSRGQKWKITYLNNGYYKISSFLNFDKVLDVTGAGISNGINLQLNDSNDTKAQEWMIKDDGKGSYYIVSNCNGLYLDIDGSKMANGTNIQLWQGYQNPAQTFKLEKIYDGEKTIEEGSYIIRSSINNNKVLDIEGGSLSNGSNIQLFQSNNTKAQEWQITYLENGYYKISSILDSNKVLDVKDASINNGTNLQLNEDSNLNSQEWIIAPTGNGYYYIISKCNGLYLDIDGSKMVNGTNIQLWQGYKNPAQTFELEKVYQGKKTIEDGIYTIRSSIDNNMVLDVAGGINNNGTNIQLYQTNGAKGQKWKITYLGNGYYNIDSLLDLTKTLDVASAGKKNGTNLQIHEKNHSRAQEWIIKEAGNGNYYIMSNCNGLYLDVDSSKMINHTNIQLWSELQNPAQTFKIMKSSDVNRVLDVSYHQGEIDWDKVANSGIYGVILRIGYYKTEDERFSEYIKEVKRLGIPYGIYLYSYSSTTNGANIEADLTKNMISKYDLNPTLGIYYDIEHWSTSSEDSYNISKSQYDNIIGTYINNVSSYVGAKYKVKVYTYTNYANNYLGDYARSQIDWIADYRSTCGYKGNYSLWQYTSEATLDGIRGFVDMSYLY